MGFTTIHKNLVNNQILSPISDKNFSVEEEINC